MNHNNLPTGTAQVSPRTPKSKSSKLRTWVIVVNSVFLASIILMVILVGLFQGVGIFGFAVLIGMIHNAWIAIVLPFVVYFGGIASGVAAVILNTIYFPGRMNIAASKTLIRILWILLNAVLYLFIWGASLLLAVE